MTRHAQFKQELNNSEAREKYKIGAMDLMIGWLGNRGMGLWGFGALELWGFGALGLYE